jgi:hypothetical protein
MSQAKYIVGEVFSTYGTIPCAICFGESISHDALRPMFAEIYGAGFFFINDEGEVKAYGKSVSLGVESREDKDAKMISKALGLVETY